MRSQHVIAAGVAAAVISVGLLSGGYGAQVRAAITLLTWWSVMLVTLFGGRRRTPLPGAALAAAGSLVGLAALALLSMSWGGDDGKAFTEGVRIAGYAGVFVLVLLLAEPGSGRAWLSGLALGLAGVACLALGSRLVPSAFPESELIRVAPGVQNRLSYPVGYWNGLGTCMTMALVLLTWLQATAASRAARAAAAAAIPIPGLALLFTSSRGGFAALTAGLLVLLAIERRRLPLLAGALPAVLGTGLIVLLALGRNSLLDGPVRSDEAASQGHSLLALTVVVVALVAVARYLVDPIAEHARVSRRVGLGLVGAACVAGVVAAVAADLPRRVDEFNDSPPTRQARQVAIVGHLGSSSGQGRYQEWQSAWRAFESEPLKGIGAGGYEAWWTREGTIFHPVRDAHSLYLEILAELGFAGALMLVVFFGAIVAGALRAVRRSEVAAAGAVAATGALAAAIDWIWELPVAFGPVVIASALLSGRALREPAAEARERRWPAVAAVALAIGAVVIGTLSFVGESELSDSRSAAGRGDLGQAAKDAKRAHAALPWSSAPWLQLALAEEQRDLGAALTAVDNAVEDAPDDWRSWVVAARIRTKAGDVRGAARALERARELNPRTPLLKD